jgi:WD40 repeat protein
MDSTLKRGLRFTARTHPNDCTASMWEAEGGVLSVWASGACLLKFAGHTDWEHALAVLPDGKLVSASADQTVRVWDRGKCLLNAEGGPHGVCGCSRRAA